MFAALHFPEFRLQAALRGSPESWDRPVVLVDPAQTVTRVCAATEAARAHDVELGMTPTQAAARCPGVLVLRASPQQEAVALEAAVQAAYGFSPNLEASASGWVTLDLRGLACLNGAGADGLRRLAEGLRSAMAGIDLRARAGAGATPNLARHAARWSDGLLIVEDAQAFVASLPLAALEPSDDAAAVLAGWGIRTVGELLALGQPDVADRLGLEALSLFAAASTTAVRPLRLTRPAERYEEAFEFPEPVETLEPLLFLLRRFGDQLCQRLSATGLAARQLRLRLDLESGAPLERALRAPEPTRNPEIVFRMLSTHLETLRADAPVVRVSLAADPAPPPQRQFDLFASPLRDPQQFQETLGRLAALVGNDRVGSPLRVPGHERDAFRMAPPDFENPPPPQPLRPPLERPTPWRRLRPGLPADVEVTPTPHGPPAPVSVHCAAARGRLTVTAGPWRASGRWWEPSGAWAREDWDAATASGGVFRLSRDARGWQVTDLLD